MDRKAIQREIDKVLHLRLFPAIKKTSFKKAKERLKKTADFQKLEPDKQHERLASYYKDYYTARETFYLSLTTLYAIYPLYKREAQIEDFESEKVYRIKADYRENGVDFSASYPTGFTAKMQQEMNDCIAELKSPKFKHIVDNYTPIKDAAKSPSPPLTNGELKYSGFYLLGFDMKYTVELAELLYKAGLITNPESQGWRIDDQYAEEMITILNQKFPEESVLQYKRKYRDEKMDRDELAIVPTHLENMYFPLNIKKTREFQSINMKNRAMEEDLKKLYEYIFYTTLSTQLKDSIYDRSKLKIKVGNKTLTQEANVLIENEENWEKLSGKLVKRLHENSQPTQNEHIVILPELKAEQVLVPIDVYAYDFNSQRPPRYGVGRFFIQILEKNNIAKNKLQEEILEDMVRSKAVKVIEKIIYPQENTMVLMDWLSEYIPSFIDLEYYYELQSKIGRVENNEIALDTLLEEINDLITAGLEKSGYGEDMDLPSDQKIILVKSIAKKNGVTLSEDIFLSNAKCDIFLAKYPTPEAIKVGKCPNCNNTVYQKEWTNENGTTFVFFACEKYQKSGGCTFSIWDSYIYKFFSDKAFELHTVDERREVLKKILTKKKGYLFPGLKPKDNKPAYDAYVYADTYYNKNKQRQDWGFQMSFPRQKKERKARY